MGPFGLAQKHGRADWEIGDPGNAGRIKVEQSGVVNLKTAGAGETRNLPLPLHVGQFILLNFCTDGGDCVVTCTDGTTKYPINAAGNNTLTFADVMESILLMGVMVGANLRWVAMNLDKAGTDGPTLSTVA